MSHFVTVCLYYLYQSQRANGSIPHFGSFVQFKKASAMKFLMLKGDARENPSNLLLGQGERQRKEVERQKKEIQCFYNITNPTNKIQCDDCKRDITKSAKVLGYQLDYCVSCFSNLDSYPSEYHAISKLDFPLFEARWTAEEELVLFEALEKFGFGNWVQIAELMGGSKTAEEVETHYLSVYLDTPVFLPTADVLSRRDSQGRLIAPVKKQANKKTIKIDKQKENPQPSSNQRSSLPLNTLTAQIKAGSNPAQIVGYMPKRGDFQVEFDNDAELLLAELQFNDDDSEQQQRMKFKIIQIYNQKLAQRNRRKEFVVGRRLLDLKEQNQLEKGRSRQEKEVNNMMKIFARFSSEEDHQKLVKGIVKEKQIRQRIEELRQLKQKGYTTLAEAQEEIDREKVDKQRGECFGKKRGRVGRIGRGGRMRGDVVREKQAERSEVVCKEQQYICQRFGISVKQYLMMRQTMIRESVRQGVIQREEASEMFRLQRNVVEGVFDFLLERQELGSANTQ